MVNATAGGSAVKLGDPGWASMEWRLAFAGLTTEEVNAIRAVFEAAEGRLRTFTFLDPTDNLIAWSEDLSAEVWTKGASIQLMPGMPDPLGTNRTTRITAGAGSGVDISQAVAVPGSFQYCFSVFARSQTAAEICLFGEIMGTRLQQRFQTGPDWRRVEYVMRPGEAGDLVTFGVEMAPGQSVDVFGFQLEAQPAASPYRKTSGQSGVYSEANFQSDALAVTSDGPDCHSCTVQIRARLH